MTEPLGCTICKMAPVARAAYLSHLMGKKHKRNAMRRDFHDKSIDKRTLQITANGDLNKYLFLIIRNYLHYDVVDVEIKRNMAFVEFPTEEMASSALKDKLEIENFFIKVEKLKFDRAKYRNYSQFPAPKKEINAPSISQNLSNLLKSNSCTIYPDELILRLVGEIELKPEDYYKREEIRFLVQCLIRPVFPDAETFLFGSSVNTLGFKGCDVDMVANLRYDCWIGRSKAESEREAEQLTKYLANHIRKSKIAYNVIAIGRARVPIVKFNCKDVGLQVDLSFKNGLPVHNTNLIKLYTNCHDIVRPYLMFLRYWAKVQGLSGGGQPSTLLTNYCLCMLMLFCIMIRKPPIVPCVGELQKDLPQYVLVDGCICNFKTDVESWRRKYHKTTLIDVAIEFFQFYSDLDFEEYVISPLAGALIPKNDIKKSKPSFSQPYLMNFYIRRLTLQMNTALCVQDPFDITHNIARGYSNLALNTFRKKCQIAADICKDIKLKKKTLSSLFEYYELITPLIDVEPSLNQNETASSSKNKTADNDVVSVASEDSVELLQELESLERFGGVEGLCKETSTKSSIDSGCDVNGSSDSMNDNDSNLQKRIESLSDNEEITFIKKLTTEDKLKSVQIVNLDDSDENDTTLELGQKDKNKSVNSGNPVSSENTKENSSTTNEENSESNKSFVNTSEDSVFVVEDVINIIDTINPSEERYNFKVKYTSNCSYVIHEDGSLKPRKRGYFTRDSRDKFVSDLLFFILEKVMKCVVQVESYIKCHEENNLKNVKKRTMGENDLPQKFQKINDGEGKAIRSRFTLLSSFDCQLLYQVWVGRKKLHKEKKIPVINPLQVEMFLSDIIAEDESLKLGGVNINVKLWKDATVSNIYWVSLRLSDREDKDENVISVFKDFFYKITMRIYPQLDEFLKWT